MNEPVFNVLMVGVGGQGIVLASDILAEAAALAGHDVKKSEIHGMSRRGGPVFSHVRFGPRVHSAVIDQGRADVILALEPMELLRWAPWAAPEAAACYLATPILPVGVDEYPDDLDAEIARLFDRLVRVELASIRRSVPMKVRNTALLGAASVFVPLGMDSFAEALRALSPRGTYEANQAAFDVGRGLATRQVKELAHVE
ncbi:MAG: indolepyruvate oxidoreductase subunit beta [Propionicimonas sp.]